MEFSSRLDLHNLNQTDAHNALNELLDAYGDGEKKGRILFTKNADGHLTGTNRSRGMTAGMQKLSAKGRGDYTEAKEALDVLLNKAFGTEGEQYVSDAIRHRGKSDDVTPGLIRYVMDTAKEKQQLSDLARDQPNVAYFVARCRSDNEQSALEQVHGWLGSPGADDSDDESAQFKPQQTTLFPLGVRDLHAGLFFRLTKTESQPVIELLQRQPEKFAKTLEQIEKKYSGRRSLTATNIGNTIQQMFRGLVQGARLDVQLKDLNEIDPSLWDSMKILLEDPLKGTDLSKRETSAKTFGLTVNTVELDLPKDTNGQQRAEANTFTIGIQRAYTLLSKNKLFESYETNPNNRTPDAFVTTLKPYLLKLAPQTNLPKPLQDLVWEKVIQEWQASPNSLK